MVLTGQCSNWSPVLAGVPQGSILACTSCQKRLGLYLDEKLNFSQHSNINIWKANKRIGIIKRLSHILPRKSLLTIYKSFIRPYLDYYDVIYDQPNNESFCTKIERI